MNQYLTNLIPLFQGVTPELGRKIAHDLSLAASDALRRQSSTIDIPSSLVGSEWEQVARASPIGANMASDPWQAYMLSSHAAETAFYVLKSGIEGVLATMPNEYRLESLPINDIGSYADSLVSHLVSLIDYAERELLVVAPYWSEKGVAAIRRSLKPRRRDGLNITLITDAHAKPSDVAGVEAFKAIMVNEFGALITHLEPRELDSGRIPTVHAKVVIADKRRAYVGSANFSQNGLSNSIEVGIAIAGTPALQLDHWFNGIRPWLRETEIGGTQVTASNK